MLDFNEFNVSTKDGSEIREEVGAVLVKSRGLFVIVFFCCDGVGRPDIEGTGGGVADDGVGAGAVVDGFKTNETESVLDPVVWIGGMGEARDVESSNGDGVTDLAANGGEDEGCSVDEDGGGGLTGGTVRRSALERRQDRASGARVVSDGGEGHGHRDGGVSEEGIFDSEGAVEVRESNGRSVDFKSFDHFASEGGEVTRDFSGTKNVEDADFRGDVEGVGEQDKVIIKRGKVRGRCFGEVERVSHSGDFVGGGDIRVVTFLEDGDGFGVVCGGVSGRSGLLEKGDFEGAFLFIDGGGRRYISERRRRVERVGGEGGDGVAVFENSEARGGGDQLGEGLGHGDGAREDGGNRLKDNFKFAEVSGSVGEHEIIGVGDGGRETGRNDRDRGEGGTALIIAE